MYLKTKIVNFQVDVVIDDRLPFWSSGKLVFANNKEQPNEYWVI